MIKSSLAIAGLIAVSCGSCASRPTDAQIRSDVTSGLNSLEIIGNSCRYLATTWKRLEIETLDSQTHGEITEGQVKFNGFIQQMIGGEKRCEGSASFSYTKTDQGWRFEGVRWAPGSVAREPKETAREPSSKAGIPSGKCDLARLSKTLASVGGVDRAMAPTMAATGVAEGCAAGLPNELAKTLRAIAGVDPVMKETIAMSGVSKMLDLWERACPKAGSNVLRDTAGYNRAARARTILEKCEAARTGWIQPSESTEADGIVVAAVIVYQALVETGLKAEIARVLARDIAGIPTSPDERKRAAGAVP